MSLVTVMLVFSFAFSACAAEAVIWAIGYIFSSVSPKRASKINIGIYLIFSVLITAGVWVWWFGSMFV